MICAINRSGNELIQEVLPRISADRSGLRVAERYRDARTNQCEPASDGEKSLHDYILSAIASGFATVWEVVEDGRQFRLRQRLQQLCDSGIVAERFADVGKPVHISWPEDEASA
jgi:hypothetical protein